MTVTKPTLAPTTWASYKKTINNRIIPALGHFKLASIRPLHIQRFIQMLGEKGQYDDVHYKQWEMRAEKAKKSGKEISPTPVKQEYLSASTIKRTHAVLQSVLGRALKLGLITSNPADGEKVDLLHIEIPDVHILNFNDAVTTLEALESEPLKYQVMIHMALCPAAAVAAAVGSLWHLNGIA